MNAGFAKGHSTKNVAENMGLDDLFKWAALKKNQTGVKVSDKKKRALNKISQFTSKVAGEWIIPPKSKRGEYFAESKNQTENRENRTTKEVQEATYLGKDF